MIRARLFGVAVATLLSVITSGAPRAEEARSKDGGGFDRSAVVARVGEQVLTAGEVDSRLAKVPPFQLATYGKTAAEARRKFVEDVLVRDMILAEEARTRGTDKSAPGAGAVMRVRSTATLRAIEAKVPVAGALPIEDVRAYFEAHKDRFEQPERLQLYRILVATKDEATAILADAKKDGTLKRFTDLAREKSSDKATNLRAGNLGFIDPGGVSNEAGVKVDPALFAAAAKVKDGEFVPEPVAEGSAFAVVWRRGSRAPQKRTVEEAAAEIRRSVYRERVDGETRALIDQLKKDKVRDVDESLLGVVELPIVDPILGAPRPGLDAAPPPPPFVPQPKKR